MLHGLRDHARHALSASARRKPGQWAERAEKPSPGFGAQAAWIWPDVPAPYEVDQLVS